MIKTLAAANKSEREHFKIPRSVQQSIPIQRIYRDGIWMVNGKYSRTWRFADINYSVASHEDQQEMFLSYCGVLNSLPTGATAKITINNRRLNGTDFQHSVLMRLKGDGLDKYRQEYNGILMEKAVESNNLIQDKYFATRWLIQIADTHAAVICQVSIALEHTISCIFLGCIDNFVCLSLSQ